MAEKIQIVTDNRMQDPNGAASALPAASFPRNAPRSTRRLSTGLVALVIALGGCATIFDAPSHEGVRVHARPESSGNGPWDPTRPFPALGPSTIDLTRIDDWGTDRTKAGATGAPDAAPSPIDSATVLRRLKEQSGGSVARRQLRRGVARFDAGRYADAKKAFDAALAADPPQREFHALARMYLGFMRCIGGDDDGGALEFRRMFAELPEFDVATDAPHAERWTPTLAKARESFGKAREPVSAGGVAVPVEFSGTSRFLVSRPGGPDAQIALVVSPGGKIVFDGREVGRTPPTSVLTVKPGRHVLTIVHDAAPPMTAELDIRDGERIELRHRQQ